MRNEGAKVVGITLRKDFGGKRNFMTHIVCIVVKWTQHDTWFLYTFTHIAESYMKYENEEKDAVVVIKKSHTFVLW